MILDILDNAERYADLHPGLDLAFAFLRRGDLAELADGRHEIDGDRVYAMVMRGPGRASFEAELETHQAYIDVQVVVEGLDEMGWKAAANCEEPTGEHDEEKDVRFFADEPDAWIAVGPGAFAVFFPEDAHLPMISDENLHKVVIKVAA